MDFFNIISAVGNLLNVPIFFLVHGTLFMLILMVVLKLRGVKLPKELDYKHPFFWVVSITICFLFLGGISFFYGIESLFRPYGFLDTITYWIYTVLFALFSACIVLYFFKKKMISEYDTMFDVMKKALRIHKSLKLNLVNAKDLQNGDWLFLQKNSNGTFVCQRIRVSLNNNNSIEQNASMDEKIKKIMMNNDKGLVEYLIINKQSLDFEWMTEGCTKLTGEYNIRKDIKTDLILYQ